MGENVSSFFVNALSVFREVKNKSSRSLEGRELRQGLGQSGIRLGGIWRPDNSRFSWQGRLKQERIGENKDRSERSSKETNNFEYFSFFTYNSTSLEVFSKIISEGWGDSSASTTLPLKWEIQTHPSSARSLLGKHFDFYSPIYTPLCNVEMTFTTLAKHRSADRKCRHVNALYYCYYYHYSC